MDFNQILLLFQVLCLYLLLTIIYRRRQRRNLFALLIPSTLFSLVHAQAWWILNQFEQTKLNTLVHLTQEISLSAEIGRAHV